MTPRKFHLVSYYFLHSTRGPDRNNNNNQLMISYYTMFHHPDHFFKSSCPDMPSEEGTSTNKSIKLSCLYFRNLLVTLIIRHRKTCCKCSVSLLLLTFQVKYPAREDYCNQVFEVLFLLILSQLPRQWFWGHLLLFRENFLWELPPDIQQVACDKHHVLPQQHPKGQR